MGLDIKLTPFTDEEKERIRVRALGKRILEENPTDPNRKLSTAFFRTKHSKRVENNGFIVVFGYEDWDKGTLRHRGYFNPKNQMFIRPINAYEREVHLNSHRLLVRKYVRWNELEADERIIGTDEKTIVAMRKKLAPNERDDKERRVAFVKKHCADTKRPLPDWVGVVEKELAATS